MTIIPNHYQKNLLFLINAYVRFAYVVLRSIFMRVFRGGVNIFAERLVLSTLFKRNTYIHILKINTKYHVCNELSYEEIIDFQHCRWSHLSHHTASTRASKKGHYSYFCKKVMYDNIFWKTRCVCIKSISIVLHTPGYYQKKSLLLLGT